MSTKRGLNVSYLGRKGEEGRQGRGRKKQFTWVLLCKTKERPCNFILVWISGNPTTAFVICQNTFVFKLLNNLLNIEVGNLEIALPQKQ